MVVARLCAGRLLTESVVVARVCWLPVLLTRVCALARHGTWRVFVGSYSPYNLLVGDNLVMDLAFMRAVVAASKWLGVGAFPEGHISTWPPPKKNEWL